MRKIILICKDDGTYGDSEASIKFVVDGDSDLTDLCDAFYRFVKAMGYYPAGPIKVGKEKDYK